jgi:hypothetical protein
MEDLHAVSVVFWEQVLKIVGDDYDHIAFDPRAEHIIFHLF